MKIGEFFRFDKTLAAAAVFLSLLGILFIYSASSYSADLQFGDSLHYVKTQAIALVLGVALMLVLSRVPSATLCKWSPAVYIAGLALLAAVFIPGLGVESYGAKRWLNLGFFTVQPSEYAKFGTVMLLARLAAKRGVHTFPRLLFYLAAGGAVCVLLLLEPNMSITVCVAAVVFATAFVAGAKPKHLAVILVPVFIAAVVLVLSEPYRVRRLLAFLNPWESPLDEGYQLIQSYYALGAGGLFGVGLFNSRQKYLFLPFAESDFILSVIGEETGLFGVLAVLAVFGIVVVRGVIIARRATDRYSCYLATGITAVIAVQTLVNVAVVCGAVPPTGLPLPFVSAGGTSLTACLAAVGMLLSISRSSNAAFLTVGDVKDYSVKKLHKEESAGGVL